MMEAKFYIYARGRWCEVDTWTGRLEGCKKRARFLYFKGGKLELAPTSKVLRGLRALVAGTQGPLRDGPPLPLRRRRHRRRSRRERDSCHRAHAVAHHHSCCVHHRCDVNANAFICKPVLPAAPAPLPPRPPRNRRIISSDEESLKENVDKSPVKKETPQLTHNIPVLRSGESGSEKQKPMTRHGNTIKKRYRIAVNSDSSKEKKSPRKKRDSKQETISISDDDDQQKSRKATDSKKIVCKDGAEKILLGISESEDSGQTEDSEPSKELVIDEDDVKVLRRYLAKRGIGNLNRFDNDEDYKKRVFYKLNPLVTLERCKPLENLLRQKMTLKEFARNLGLRSVAEVTPEKRYRMRASTKLARTAVTDSETDKENIVRPKRRKLWNNDKELFNSVSSRASEVKPRAAPKPAVHDESSRDTTDSDTEFKRKVREQLDRKSKQRAAAAERQETSSVETEMEQRTTRSSMKEAERKSNAASVTSSEDVTRRTRSSDRHRIPAGTLREQNKPTESSDSAFETKQSKKPAERDKVPKNGDTPVIRNKKGRFVRAGKKTVVEKVERMRSAAVQIVRSVMAVNPVTVKNSSVPPGREYTNLEDHAIIAWVSAGGRERRVNGNALWRELQADYRGITGQTRSWHSLRNRYLRYLLPSLGRLALPPHQVSRLRAAAAAGVMKVGSAHQRRNSIFGAPAVRSASARAPGAPGPRGASPEPDTAEAEDETSTNAQTAPAAQKTSPAQAAASTPLAPRRAPPPPSPSYSAVTRRFRTRASAPLSPSASAAGSASPAPRKTLKRKAKQW